ncbi:HNH endonuclease [Mycobacterium phage ArcherS7]|uniref:HNH nuclease domain-containing protein n=9 Tax=Bixzunavirus TaxID=680114 RepID=A0A411CCQ4_9CAUD|nr:HNH endonuclease [Mycobacterium phage ArcherS7]YP_009012808.1 HNH endonuclease [Mycobacterium phage Dandelion]YP_010057898.1 HNH endonuclease [Mycobacterium phage NoodleTree]YP_010058349.1 HNH endonuclease [Mycobacterium phage Quasimodo]AEJ94999.1 hypothetical protein GHOST_25 [Mycobacterium phage Ghost]AKG94591.1 hypothetical protein SEA_MOMO_24 [Mycobacterium phage Momo]ALF50889.1 HNH endonuclease [Mycobacterium phage DTDevon]ANT41563.1 HNH endonuclease [Mycobacterium phage Littleton]A
MEELVQVESVCSYPRRMARIALPPGHPFYDWAHSKPPAPKKKTVRPAPKKAEVDLTPVIVQGYRYLIVVEDHPLKTSHRGRRVAEHRLVLWKHIGPGTHPCHWCGKPVTWGEDLQVDHVDWDKLNNVPDNLVPSCRPCNFDRHNPNRPKRQELHKLPREEIRRILEQRKL